MKSCAPPFVQRAGVAALERGLERLVHRIDRDAHQHPQRVAGDIVGRLGRSTREGPEIGIVLLLEQRLGEGAVGLRRLDHVRSGRILLAVGREGRRGAMDLHVAQLENLEHLEEYLDAMSPGQN